MSEEILEESNVAFINLVLILYRGVQGAIREIENALEEYKIKRKNFADYDQVKEGIETVFRKILRGYVEKLPLSQRIVAKTFLSLSWSDVSKCLYHTMLEFGKNGDGTYKSTEETIIDFFKKYLGRKHELFSKMV
jgi:hypothetical protein